MKRTRLELDEKVLKEAMRLSGDQNRARMIERAVEDFVRRTRTREILELEGSGLWVGRLAEMRRDESAAGRLPARS